MAKIPLLAQTTVAAATTTTGSSKTNRGRTALMVQSTFVYAAGGTTCKVFVQTSFDGGTSWVDIISHAFTTASGVKNSTVTTYIAPASQAFTPTDGTLTDNTIIQGTIGDLLRAKVISTGTYTGTTHITVNAITV